MQKQRPSLMGSQMADERLESITGQKHRNQNIAPLRQAQRKFVLDCRKDSRQHACEHINQEMNTCKHKKLHPVKCCDSSIQVSTYWYLKFVTSELFVCFDIFITGFGSNIIRQLDTLGEQPGRQIST